ncbi:hypothetical protein CCAX7_002570 [Capsulimonas corticalis]|uniref:Uncharacterized protein n=1 Tax=Capsulimonas corticalis TaxID=2219043 RepID=A0A402CS42_9BACT|nr:DUF1573 domain-containing protein [Capsulimonas corticalis]BDI28206.1 hypothetical protein CCAX7_002570 [Capsulimonas corticalis]
MRISIVALIAVSVLVGVGVASKVRGSETPNVSVLGGLVYDAGRTPAGHPLTHVYRLNNPHSFPVGLSIVTTGCECTTAQASAAVIPAHGKADVTLRVKLEDTNNISAGACFATTHGGQRVETWLLLTGQIDRGAIRAEVR